MKNFFIFILLCSFFISPKTKANIEELWVLNGLWNVEYFGKDKEGNEKSLGRDISKYEASLGGKLIEESSTILVPGGTFTMRNFYSYDKARKKYRMAAIDQPSGLMDIYEGNFKEGLLTMTNLAHKTFFVRSDGQSMAFKLQWTLIDNDHFELQVEMSADEGKTWQYMSHAKAKRLY